MQKHSLKFTKVITNIACAPLILISNNSELAAKHASNEVDKFTTTLEIKNFNNSLFQEIDIKKEENFFIAENKNNIEQESVLVSEIISKAGKSSEVENLNWLRLMSIKPSIVDNQI